MLVALAACSRAGAAPSPPAGWREAPELADAARTAAGSAAEVHAWAEPARGCYALALAMRGAAGPVDAARDALVASLARAGVATTSVEKRAPGDVRVRFARLPYHGALHATLAANGDVAATACAWNEREPAACEAGCTALFGEQL